jgi:hypothetical protein
MVELQLPKLVVRVRFPSLAPRVIYLRGEPGFSMELKTSKPRGNLHLGVSNCLPMT